MTALIHLIAAARPNFMKIAPLYHELTRADWCRPEIVHTGQHYDVNMSDAFFQDLNLPEPHHHLGVGSGTHAEQTGKVMMAYEKICLETRPDWTIVAGDVNSTVACTLAATKLHIPVAHLEAGLRSGDRSMPEELNRVATDALADLLWPPSADGTEHLLAEGVPPERVEMIGNIMIDSYEMMRPSIEATKTREKFNLPSGGYAVMTLHRPGNVDAAETLTPLIDAILDIATRLPIVFAVHPRTHARLKEFDLLSRLEAAPDVHLSAPLGYVDFMGLVREARLIATDSGGIQEETTYLHIPCLTLRPNTERPITSTLGTNRLVTAEILREAVETVLAGNWPIGEIPPLWDGRTAARAAKSLKARL